MEGTWFLYFCVGYWLVYPNVVGFYEAQGTGWLKSELDA